MAAVLAVGLFSMSAPDHRAAAEVSVNATCTGNISSSVTLGVFHFGLTGRVCTDGKMVWNWSSSYPSNCWVSYPAYFHASGVCGYAGNFTSSFSYIEKVTLDNFTPLLVQLAWSLAGIPPLILPSFFESKCTVYYTYTPYRILHNQGPSAYASCSGPYPIY
jgi:hypothetical protein